MEAQAFAARKEVVELEDDPPHPIGTPAVDLPLPLRPNQNVTNEGPLALFVMVFFFFLMKSAFTLFAKCHFSVYPI